MEGSAPSLPRADAPAAIAFSKEISLLWTTASHEPHTRTLPAKNDSDDMTKTLTQYPGVVNYLLTRTAHLPPPAPRNIPRDPLALPAKCLRATQRVRIRHQISHSIANVTDSHLQLCPARAPGHMRIEWHHPAPEPRLRSNRLYTFIITAVPLLFIVAIAFVAGCLAAVLETSFGP